jgi:hypothetical protein
MAKAEIFAGVCGFSTVVETTANGRTCRISISSQCEAIQRLGQELTQVNPFQEISFRKAMPQTLQMGAKYCTHAACPVPVGIIKAIEVESGLALPADVSIKIAKTPKDEGQG